MEHSRVKLTSLTPQDATEMFALLSEPKCYEFIAKKPPSSPEELLWQYQRQAKGKSPDGTEHWFNWIARESSTGFAMGFVQASSPIDSAQAQIGYLFHPRYWGKGYAFEALTEMFRLLETEHKIAFLWASIDPRNTRSIKLLEKLAFVPSTITPSQNGDVVMEKYLFDANDG